MSLFSQITDFNPLGGRGGDLINVGLAVDAMNDLTGIAW